MSGRRAVFRLFACCVPVRGARRSTLCDLQRQSYDLVPNALLDLLAAHAEHTLEEIRAAFPPEQHARIDEYYRFLEEKEYGFWCDDPGAFPPLEMAWERPQPVTNAIVDVDAGSRHDFAALLQQLDEVGCGALQLRYFSPQPLEEVEKVLGMSYRGRLRSIELLLPWCGEWAPGELHALVGRHPRVAGVVVHSAPGARVEKVEQVGTPVFYRTEVVGSADHCGQVGPEWFSVSMAGFTEARHFNSCLNRKVSVDARGEIRNCPSMPVSFGNAAETRIAEVVAHPAFAALWGITKDEVEVCRDCEFRYVCTDCRAFVANPADVRSKPARCTYDPYTARWDAGAAPTPR